MRSYQHKLLAINLGKPHQFLLFCVELTPWLTWWWLETRPVSQRSSH